MPDICPECSVQDCNECLPEEVVSIKTAPFNFGRTGPLVLSKSQIDEVISKKELKNLKSTEEGRVVKTVSFKVSKKESEDYLATDEELSLINTKALSRFKEDNRPYVFLFQAADDQVDRGYEHFTRSALRGMAELAVKNSIPWLTDGDYDHQWRQKNIYGVVFDAFEKAGKLFYKVYVPNIERNKNVLDAVLTGLYSKLSVGFSLDLNDFVCDTCKKSIFLSDCEHYPGMMDEKGNIVTATIKGVKDNYEISGVAVPMQPEAHITGKSVSTADSFTLNYNSNLLKERTKELLAKYSIESLKKSPIDTINIDNNELETEMPDLKNVTDEQNVDSQEDSNPVAPAEGEGSQEPTSQEKSVPTVEKEINVKVSLDESQLVELVKSLIEKVEALSSVFEKNVEAVKALSEKVETDLETVKSQLAVATEATSDALTRKLQAAQKTEPKHWVLENFSVDLAKNMGDESENV